jgi:UNC-6/NTR/C345C module
MPEDENQKVNEKVIFSPPLSAQLIHRLPFPRSYLILGNDEEGPANALGISENSIVIEWRDEWYRRLRKYQRQSHTCD